MTTDGASAGPPPKRILIVDNHGDAAESLALLLRAMGHEACVARNASNALQIFCQMLPHIVLLDIAMPEMSDYELARRMRGVLGGAVKLCVLTGNDGQQDHLRSREVGLDHHFVKPVKPEILMHLLA